MFTSFNDIVRAFCVLALGAISAAVMAEPYLAVQTDNQCNVCHINPTGGGARNSFGNFYGTQLMPIKPGDAEIFDPGILGDTIRIGADIRANYNYKKPETGPETQGFETQSAQLYFHLKPKNVPISLYIDQQVAPGSALNREAFLMYQLSEKNYVKAGRIYLPYGLRIEDDTSLVRSSTQFNFDTNDNGLELGLEFKGLSITTAVTNGTSRANNDDRRLQYIGRMEYHTGKFRGGFNAAMNSAEAGQRLTSGIFGGVNLYDYVILAEWNQISDESIQNSIGDDQSQEVLFLELNKLISKGINLKLTYEYLDPDINIGNDERTLTSAQVEVTPIANFQIRGGLRFGEDIPQRDAGNFDQFFLQGHLYF